jgi:transcriptional regulator with XRE-family HTH domain
VFAIVHQSQSVIMPKARRTSYNLSFKLKVIAEAEAVENNSEIAREYGISESMVRRWRKDQANLFNGELKLSAKRKTMGRFTSKYPEHDQRLLEWFTDQSSFSHFVYLKRKKSNRSCIVSCDLYHVTRLFT